MLWRFSDQSRPLGDSSASVGFPCSCLVRGFYMAVTLLKGAGRFAFRNRRNQTVRMWKVYVKVLSCLTFFVPRPLL